MNKKNFVNGFVGFEVKENIQHLEAIVGPIHPFISVYEFNNLGRPKLNSMVELLDDFVPVHPSSHSQYNRRRKRFNNYRPRLKKHDPKENKFWYHNGLFEVKELGEHEDITAIIGKNQKYLVDILRPVLIHLKLDKKESYPYWFLEKNKPTKEYNQFKHQQQAGTLQTHKLPKANIRLEHLGIFVKEDNNYKKIFSIELK